MLVVLNPERIAVATMGVGIMAAVYEEAFAYVKQRQAALYVRFLAFSKLRYISARWC